MSRWIWQHPDWPKFTWRESDLLLPLADARRLQGRLQGVHRLLDRELSMEAQAKILVEDGINTSAIEGEKVDLDAIRSSVARKLGLPTSGFPEPSRAVSGLVDVLFDATTRFDDPLTRKRLFGWQAALFPTGYSGLHPVRTGRLRDAEPMRVISGPVGSERIHFEAPPEDRLAKEVDAFLRWFEAAAKDEDGLIRAGLAHLRFVTIHPFEDGNGRIARAITDMAIARDERQTVRLFSLSAQIMRTRKGYYEILEKTQRGGIDVTPWLAWFLGQVGEACSLAEDTVGNVLAKAKFWMAHQQAHLNDRQRKVLNRLLDAGPEGFEGGMTTRKYEGMTKTSRATAYRELSELVSLGCMEVVGSGRGTCYRLVPVTPPALTS